MRADGRAPDHLRPISFERDFTEMAAGSCLVSFGQTRVLCTASIDEDVPRWMRGRGTGWVTAEYSMLPGSSPERVRREVKDGKPSGRSQEIQRLIGRALRSVCDMGRLGERQVIVDCDVLQADGGTRTASICGGYVALHDALARLVQQRAIPAHPLTAFCAAISVGVVDGEPLLDLPYVEDAAAQVDMNVVMTSEGRFVEVQGTAEGRAFTRSELDSMLSLGEKGIAEIIGLQQQMVAEPPAPRPVSTQR
jgi:ribonuclease PH